MPSRRIRRPSSRSCSQIGLFHVGGRPLEDLGAPDVVDQDVDGAVVAANLVGEGAHLTGVEVIDLDRDALAAQLVDQCGGLLDGFGAVVVGLLVARHGSFDPCTPPSRRPRPALRQYPGPRRGSRPATTATRP